MGLPLFVSWREAWLSWSAAVLAALGSPPTAWDWEARAAWTDWAAELEGEGVVPPWPMGEVGMPEGVALGAGPWAEPFCGGVWPGFCGGFWPGFWGGF